MDLGENAAQATLHDHRINPRREFFHIAPPPDFSEVERNDYTQTSIYLDALLELIEEVIDMAGVSHERITHI